MYDSSVQPRLAFPPLTRWVKFFLILNAAVWIAVYLLDLINPAIGNWIQLNLGLSLARVWFEPWQLLTSMVLHERFDPWHLIGNSIGLYFFGVFLESFRGGREFLQIYVVGGLVGGIFYLLINGVILGSPQIPAMGASGAILAVIVATATFFPRSQVWLFGMLPIQMWLIATIFVSLDLIRVLSQLRYGMGMGVAASAHLGGALFGFLYARNPYYFQQFLGRFRNLPAAWRRRQQQRIWKHKRDRSRRVDALLDKINREGQDSLTRSELSFLKKASREMARKD